LHDAPAGGIGSHRFFTGIHHARNGRMRRDPNNPLSPNYKFVPVAYHSRASSVRPSGVPFSQPSGQRKLPEEEAPLRPCRRLVTARTRRLGGTRQRARSRSRSAEAGDHLFGLGLFNDWSARDIQQ
jgi:fumarylacetoacetase